MNKSRKIREANFKYGNAEFIQDKKSLIDKERVYKHIFREFVKEIEKDNVKLITILNLRKENFIDQKDLLRNDKIDIFYFNILKDVWTNYNNAYYDQNEAIKFIELNSSNIVKQYKYLGHVCDDHYSKYGAKYISDVITKLIKS